MRVTRDIESPRGGWRFTAATGVTVTGTFYSTLRNRVGAHLNANGLDPIPDEELQDMACRESDLGSPFCGAVPEPEIPGMPALTLTLAARFLKTVWGVIRDRKFVPREEAERRAAICLACPMHRSTIGGCRGCHAVFRKVQRVMKSYPLDSRLGWCAACGCSMVKLWIPNETLDAAESDRPPYADGCWRLAGRI